VTIGQGAKTIYGTSSGWAGHSAYGTTIAIDNVEPML
jgi:hypothetical protein